MSNLEENHFSSLLKVCYVHASNLVSSLSRILIPRKKAHVTEREDLTKAACSKVKEKGVRFFFSISDDWIEAFSPKRTVSCRGLGVRRRAAFLGRNRTLSVSAEVFPAIRADTIYLQGMPEQEEAHLRSYAWALHWLGQPGWHCWLSVQVRLMLQLWMNSFVCSQRFSVIAMKKQLQDEIQQHEEAHAGAGLEAWKWKGRPRGARAVNSKYHGLEWAM